MYIVGAPYICPLDSLSSNYVTFKHGYELSAWLSDNIITLHTQQKKHVNTRSTLTV